MSGDQPYVPQYSFSASSDQEGSNINISGTSLRSRESQMSVESIGSLGYTKPPVTTPRITCSQGFEMFHPQNVQEKYRKRRARIFGTNKRKRKCKGIGKLSSIFPKYKES